MEKDSEEKLDLGVLLEPEALGEGLVNEREHSATSDDSVYSLFRCAHTYTHVHTPSPTHTHAHIDTHRHA